MEYVVLYLVVYVAQVITCTGWAFAHFNGEYPSFDHRPFSYGFGLFAAFLPIVGILMVFFLSEFAKYGWAWPHAPKMTWAEHYELKFGNRRL
jgi:hypothetical protein